jgi:toxin secretion/phage lysis holin
MRLLPPSSSAIVKTLFAVTIALITRAFGAWEAMHTILLTLVVLDVAAGFTRAFVQKKLSSKESFRGIVRKVLIFLMVALAYQVDCLLSLEGATQHIVIAFYCASEALSIIENVAAAGLPIPDALRAALAQLAEKKFGGGQ